MRHPRPFVPTVFTYGVEVAAFGIALVAAFARGRSALGAVAIAFTLAARMATDIPLHALALALGALLAPLAAAHSLREAPAKAATN